MTVTTKEEAWRIANKLFPSDYEENHYLSSRAGYKVYTSTSDTYKNTYTQIDDLCDRLEVIINGKSTNIWIVPYSEYQIADALEQINEAAYQFEDKVNWDLAEEIGFSNKMFQDAFHKIYEILKRDYPESQLIKKYNLF